MGRVVANGLLLLTRLPFVSAALLTLLNWAAATAFWYGLMASQAQAGQVAPLSYLEAVVGLSVAGVLLWGTNFVPPRTFFFLWSAVSPWLAAGSLVLLMV